MPCPMMESSKDEPADKLPPYFPQPGDELPVQPEKSMEAIGPWATGRVTFAPTDGLTGIRPVVDRYSVTQSGGAQWRAHNMKFFKQSDEKIRDAQYMNKLNFYIYFPMTNLCFFCFSAFN